MEDKKLTALKQLWKMTFHDSDEYIDMIYDNYYDPELCIERYSETGKLIASLTAIPYNFSVDKIRFKALYLCGLSTVVEYRGRGIMSEMMKEIEERAKGSDYDFLFLIPADERLRKYYARKGYVSRMDLKKILISRYDIEKISAILKRENDEKKNIAQIFRVSESSEIIPDYNTISLLSKAAIDLENESYDDLYVSHSFNDFTNTIIDSLNSGETVIYMKDIIEDKITGLAIIEKISRKDLISDMAERIPSEKDSIESSGEEGDTECQIKYLLAENPDTGIELIERILSSFKVERISLLIPATNKIWRIMETINLQGELEKYGMIKILRENINTGVNELSVEENLESENGKFSTVPSFGQKYSILRNLQISGRMFFD